MESVAEVFTSVICLLLLILNENFLLSISKTIFVEEFGKVDIVKAKTDLIKDLSFKTMTFLHFSKSKFPTHFNEVN